jgi:hypothetical protein
LLETSAQAFEFQIALLPIFRFKTLSDYALNAHHGSGEKIILLHFDFHRLARHYGNRTPVGREGREF